MSNKQLTIAGILALGYTETHRSSKYRTFLSSKPGSTRTLMVGKSGALRSTDGPLTASRSVTGMRQHKAYIYVGKVSQQLPNLNREQLLHVWRKHYAGEIIE